MNRLPRRVDANSPTASRLANGLTLLLLAVTATLLVRQASFFPEINPDEAGAYLGLQLQQGHFAFPLDPDGPGYIRYYFLDCYPPLYYLFNAILFKFAGFGIVQARSVTIGFLIGCGALCSVVVRRGGGTAAGLLTLALFIGLVPTRVYYWIVNRPDIAAHFFTILALALLLPPLLPQERKAGLGRGLIVGFAYSLATQSHYIALLAGPMVAGFTLWRAGWRPWSSALAWGALIGLAVAWIPFLWAAWPYRDAILGGLLGYGETIPVVERLVAHIKALAANFAWIIYGLAPLALGVAVLGTGSARLRRRGGGALYCWSLVFLAAFAAVSFYSNNTLVWYYGLTYLFAGIILAGLVAGALLPRQGTAGAVTLLLCAGSTIIAVGYLWHRVNRLIEWSEGIPVATAFEGLSNRTDLVGGPTIAPIHFVFSAAGERVLDPRVVVNQEGSFAIVPNLARAVPELPPLGDYKATIIDHGRSVYDAQALLWHARAWRSGKESHPLKTLGGASLMASRRFALQKVMADPGHGSGNWSLWGGEPNGTSIWPELAMATPAGAINLHMTASCDMPSATPISLEPILGPIPLWRLRLSVSFASRNTPLALHAVLASPDGAAPPPLGLLASYPSLAEADLGWIALQQHGRYPFLSATPRHRIATIAPARGPDAEVTMLILPPTNLAEQGVVDILTIEPAWVKQLLIAAPAPEACASVNIGATR